MEVWITLRYSLPYSKERMMRMGFRFATALLFAAVVLSGCGKSGDRGSSYTEADGERLANKKCATCHDLHMPAKTSENEVAPPMFAVAVHLKDWMKSDSPAMQRAKFIDFVQDYVINPSPQKSYCDPASLKSYGLMPSQKGKVNREELAAIAGWVYDHFDQKAMLEIIRRENYLKSLPPYKRVLETKDCKVCHISGADRVAPSFEKIAQRYGIEGLENIKRSIREGSRGRWKGYSAPMRAYGKDMSEAQIEAIAKWIAAGGREKGR